MLSVPRVCPGRVVPKGKRECRAIRDHQEWVDCKALLVLRVLSECLALRERQVLLALLGRPDHREPLGRLGSMEQ